ncbi:hypothetical protein ACE6H2_022954 [Prunus campanulata]
MKHISLSLSTELAEIAISVTLFRTPSSPRSPSPSHHSVHRARPVRHLPSSSRPFLSPQMDSHLPFYEL